MSWHIATVAVVILLIAFAISAVALSIMILSRGKLYERLSPETRPRRWILISVVALFAEFVIAFSVWMMCPDALVSRVLLGAFGVAFFLVGFTIRLLTPQVDAYVKRKGWQLR
jgi:amino acid transporter